MSGRAKSDPLQRFVNPYLRSTAERYSIAALCAAPACVVPESERKPGKGQHSLEERVHIRRHRSLQWFAATLGRTQALRFRSFALLLGTIQRAASAVAIMRVLSYSSPPLAINSSMRTVKYKRGTTLFRSAHSSEECKRSPTIPKPSSTAGLALPGWYANPASVP